MRKVKQAPQGIRLPPKGAETRQGWRSQTTLILDIETAPYLIRSWGTYETNALEIVEEVKILSVGYRWLGDKKTTVEALDTHTEDELLRIVNQLLAIADVIVAHNGDKFDLPMLRARMLKLGFQPPSPSRTVDTLKIARKQFKLPSNRLDSLGSFLGLGNKVEHEGYGLWKKVLAGDKDAWSRMKRYNARDVDLLHDVYLRLRPWAPSHPVAGPVRAPQTLGEGLEDKECRVCGSPDLESRGYWRTAVLTKRKWRCRGCGAWTSFTVPKRLLDE